MLLIFLVILFFYINVILYMYNIEIYMIVEVILGL